MHGVAPTATFELLRAAMPAAPVVRLRGRGAHAELTPPKDGRNDAGLKGLAVSALVAAMTLSAGLLMSAISDIRQRREQTERSTQASCANPNDCGPENLQADLRAAVAAEDVVDLAIWQLALSAAGVAGVGFTVRYAHLAWREAAKSAGAALRTFEAENRTWLTIRPAEFESLSHDGNELRVSVRMEIQNVGAKPAFDVHLDMRAFIAPTGVGPDAVDREIAFGKHFAELPGNAGVILLANERHHMGFSSPASPVPETEDRLRAIGLRVRPGERVLSLVYCTHYKSPGFQTWHVSAGVMHIMRRDAEPLTKGLGLSDVVFLPTPNFSRMT